MALKNDGGNTYRHYAIEEGGIVQRFPKTAEEVRGTSLDGVFTWLSVYDDAIPSGPSAGPFRGFRVCLHDGDIEQHIATRANTTAAAMLASALREVAAGTTIRIRTNAGTDNPKVSTVFVEQLNDDGEWTRVAGESVAGLGAGRLGFVEEVCAAHAANHEYVPRAAKAENGHAQAATFDSYFLAASAHGLPTWSQATKEWLGVFSWLLQSDVTEAQVRNLDAATWAKFIEQVPKLATSTKPPVTALLAASEFDPFAD